MSQDRAGIRRLFRQFSTPGGIPSHVSVTAGINPRRRRAGYVLMHAFGSVFDNPDLLAIAVVGDGELRPDRSKDPGRASRSSIQCGMELCRSCINGAKIGGPTVLARKPQAEVRSLFQGHGYDVIEVEGSDLPGMHHRFAAAWPPRTA